MIKQLIPEGFCLQCQGCCRFEHPGSAWSPNLLDKDREALLTHDVPALSILNNKKIRLVSSRTQGNFICSFLGDKDNRCKVYAFRPFECQLYPFLINRSSKDIFLAVDLKCPFVQEQQKSAAFQRHIEYLTGFFSRSEICGVLNKNPQIIQEYPEVRNLVLLNI